MASDVTLEQVAEYCTQLDLMHRIDAERRWVNATLVTRHGAHLLSVRVDSRQVLVLHVAGLLMVPAERRRVVAHGLSHINYALLLGAFALDLTDGEVTFHLPIPFRGMEVCFDQVAQSLSAIAWTLNNYLPQIQQLCWGSASVEEVLGLPLPAPADALARALTQEGATGTAAPDPPGASPSQA